MNDSDLVSILSASYSKQLAWYEELSRIVQKTLSQIILSRGDIAVITKSILQKQKIIDLIGEERDAIKESVELFKHRKAQLTISGLTNNLDLLLAESESAIKEFLEGEDQLKRYLEHAMPLSGNVSG
jgi:hypothetical protein